MDSDVRSLLVSQCGGERCRTPGGRRSAAVTFSRSLWTICALIGSLIWPGAPLMASADVQFAGYAVTGDAVGANASVQVLMPLTQGDAAIAANQHLYQSILQQGPTAIALKADGLAAGKGVVIAATLEEAEETLADMFGGAFGGAGAQVVIEEFMEGEEASFFALTDGTHIIPFGSAQDHKRVGDGDTGPNTGGMGAYSPARVLTPELEAQVLSQIIAPTVKTMADEGMPYSGVLYAGLMLTEQGPKLIEYNARFGDPECQVLMMRLESDLVELLLACADNKLSSIQPPRFSNEVAMTVVMAAEGYPGTPKKGGRIDHIPAAEATGARVFHAGTALSADGVLSANGGRVLNVTAKGPSVKAARDAAYAAVDAISFPEGFCRRDIGWREIEREQTEA